MKFLQPPLLIDCDGLSKKLVADLADRLSMHFMDVKIWSDTIESANPLDDYHYSKAWHTIDKFDVKAF